MVGGAGRPGRRRQAPGLEPHRRGVLVARVALEPIVAHRVDELGPQHVPRLVSALARDLVHPRVGGDGLRPSRADVGHGHAGRLVWLRLSNLPLSNMYIAGALGAWEHSARR